MSCIPFVQTIVESRNKDARESLKRHTPRGMPEDVFSCVSPPAIFVSGRDVFVDPGSSLGSLLGGMTGGLGGLDGVVCFASVVVGSGTFVVGTVVTLSVVGADVVVAVVVVVGGLVVVVGAAVVVVVVVVKGGLVGRPRTSVIPHSTFIGLSVGAGNIKGTSVGLAVLKQRSTLLRAFSNQNRLRTYR